MPLSTLEEEMDDEQAIREIMEAYDVDMERARELWEKWKKTVKRLQQRQY